MNSSINEIKEIYLEDYPIPITSESTEIILSQMKKCICKIYMNNGNKGTGFFCKIPFPDKEYLQFLITNNHIIDENSLNEDTKIFFTINNDEIKKEINIGKRRVYTSQLYDTTIIEIFEDKDGIHDSLELDFDLIGDNHNNLYIKKSIYILHYPNMEKVSVSYGIIKDIDLKNKFDIRHLCCTKEGSSGSPILNLKNNRIIGIHKGAYTNYNYNKGTLLNYPIKEFISKETKNKIRGIFELKSNNFCILFNTNIKEKIDVFLDNKKLDMIKEDNKWITFGKSGKKTFEIIFDYTINNMRGFFENCINLVSLDFTNFDSTNVTDFGRMFYNCKALREIKAIDKLITKKVTNMQSMFQLCCQLEYLDLSNFDTSNVTDMSYMFTNCKKLKEIKGLNKFITSKVKDMRAMFPFCTQLEYLDLSNFDTSNVINMESMFYSCNKLKEIKGINNFITNRVTKMRAMFGKCPELEILDLSNFDTSDVTNMSFMFEGCKKLKNIEGVTKFNTSKVTTMEGMFCDCFVLENLNLLNFDETNVTNMDGMFFNCYKLQEIQEMNNAFIQGYNIHDMFSFQNYSDSLNLQFFDINKSSNNELNIEKSS